MQMHTWMIILGLLGRHWVFSAMTSLRVRAGARWALEGANERQRGSLNFNRMLLGVNSHHLCMSSVPKSHSFFQELKDPDCSNILSGKRVCHHLLHRYVLGEKSFNESVGKSFSHPALALDNDIAPAVANSSRAEDVPEDKCYYQLSVMWAQGSKYIILMVVYVSYFCSFCRLFVSYNVILIIFDSPVGRLGQYGKEVVTIIR